MVRRCRTITNVQEGIALFQLSQPNASSHDNRRSTNDSFDSNNNVVLKQSSQYCSALRDRKATTSACDRKQNIQQPCYVPNYIRTVSFKCSRLSNCSSVHSTKKASVSLHQSSENKRHGHESTEETRQHYKPCKDLARLREKYRISSIPEIHVKSAVAAMESQIDPKQSPCVRIVKSTAKPRAAPKPTFLRPKAQAERLGVERKSKHRRSMSDPNVHKTFMQMKQLWDNKVESEKQPERSGSRSGSVSSSNSIGSSKSLDRKALTKRSDENLNVRARSPSIVINPPATNMTRSVLAREPVVPPKPRGRKSMRSRADTAGQLDSPSIQPISTNNVTSPPSKSLSVSEKAILFGGTKPRSLQEDKQENATQPKPQSPAFQRRIPSWSEDHVNQSKDKMQTFDEKSYSRQRNKSEAVNSHKRPVHGKEVKGHSKVPTDFQTNVNSAKVRKTKEPTVENSTNAFVEPEISKSEKSILFSKTVEDENRILNQPRINRQAVKDGNSTYATNSSTNVSSHSEVMNSCKLLSRNKDSEDENEVLRSNDRNKERKVVEKIADSPSNTTDDDEEELGRRRKGSFLNNARKRSKDNATFVVKDKPQAPSPLAIKKTEINNSEKTLPLPSNNDQRHDDEVEFKGRRRASSLQKLAGLKYSSVGKSLLQSSLSDRSEDEKSNLNKRSESPARPTNLPLLQRERSYTDGRKREAKTICDLDRQKGGSTGKLNKMFTGESAGSVSPSTPDQRSSGFSESDLSPAIEVVYKPSRPAPPPPPSKTSKLPTSNAQSEVADKTVQGETTSLSSVDSYGQQRAGTPRLVDLDILDVYNNIVKEASEGGNVSNMQTRPGSQDCSIESIDSGFRNSLEVPPNNHGAGVDSWSDFDNSDEDEPLPGTLNKQRTEPISPVVFLKEPNEVKIYNIAKELLSTEESYVAILHLIDQVFHKQVREAAVSKHIMPEQVVNNIFCHIPAIYQFHSSFLLPQLKERLRNWNMRPRIGDIMTKAAPFLKMYSLYVQNFDDAMNAIKLWSEKSNGFASIMKAIQQTPECNFLTLQHHMLSPVQRVPRYRLLLEDYVKRLPEDAEDKEEAETALKLITIAATHSNETMKKIEKFHKLVNIFNALADVKFDIVDVTRELLKEGKITKISARNGEKYERYLYLFSDMLLCCSPLRRLQGKSYKVTAKIDLDGMEITKVKNPTVPHAFCVNGLQKSMEFASNSSEEKESWIQAIASAIDERKDRLQTFKRGESVQDEIISATNSPISGSPAPPASPNHVSKQPIIDITDADLGTRAPRWIKDHEVTMCMCCSKVFNKLLRRRHHCRACGRVVCSECSENKIQLQYDSGKPLKVCSACYDVLTGGHHQDSADSEKKGVLEVQADIVSENSVIAGYLFVTENEKKRTWTKTWCVIPNGELCLYFYGAHQDVRAQMTMPLPGFEVIDIFFTEHKYCFKLKQARRVFLFATDDEDCNDRWKYALIQASKGEDLNKEDVFRLGKASERRESTSEEGSEGSLEEDERNKAMQRKASIQEQDDVTMSAEESEASTLSEEDDFSENDTT